MPQKKESEKPITEKEKLVSEKSQKAKGGSADAAKAPVKKSSTKTSTKTTTKTSTRKTTAASSAEAPTKEKEAATPAKKKATTKKASTTGATRSAAAKKSTATRSKKPTEKEETQKIPTPATDIPATDSPAPPPVVALPSLEAGDSHLPVAGPGAAVEPAVPPIVFPPLKQERRNFFGMLLMFVLLGAVVIGSIFIFLHRPTTYSEREHSVRFFYYAESNTTAIAVDGTLLESTYQGECSAHMYDADGSTSAALIGGTLYLIEGREVSALGTNVLDFVLSQNGKALAYRNAENKLFYCTLGRKVVQHPMSSDTRDSRYCLSPNGKELFYTYVREESTRVEIYSETNSKPHLEVVTGLVPVAIADNGEFYYYQNAQTGALYYRDADAEKPILMQDGSVPYALQFNRDFSEVMLESERGTQIWKNGEQLVIPNLKAGEHLVLLPNKRAASRTLSGSYQYLIKSFEKSYYLKTATLEDGTMLMYLHKKGELSLVQRLDALLSNPVVTDKGVYFLLVETRENNEVRKHLYRCKIGETEPERLYFDVMEFCVNTDGSALMFTDSQYAVYGMKVSGDLVPDRWGSNINAASLQVTSDDVFYYYVGSALYTSENGAEPRLVRDGVALVQTDAHTAYFLVPEEGKTTFTVYANYRNRRRDSQIATGVSYMK